MQEADRRDQEVSAIGLAGVFNIPATGSMGETGGRRNNALHFNVEYNP